MKTTFCPRRKLVTKYRIPQIRVGNNISYNLIRLHHRVRFISRVFLTFLALISISILDPLVSGKSPIWCDFMCFPSEISRHFLHAPKFFSVVVGQANFYLFFFSLSLSLCQSLCPSLVVLANTLTHATVRFQLYKSMRVPKIVTENSNDLRKSPPMDSIDRMLFCWK